MKEKVERLQQKNLIPSFIVLNAIFSFWALSCLIDHASWVAFDDKNNLLKHRKWETDPLAFLAKR